MGRQMPVVPFPERELPEPTSPGAMAFERYCKQCHVLPSPKAHTADEWSVSLDRMVSRMRMMEREQDAPWGQWMPAIATPSVEELARLREYLRENALRPAPEALAPEAQGPGGDRFAQVCSQCHALPDPALHTAAEWPAVVSRMHVNMQRMGVRPPEDQARGQILAFLTEHARP
jgi:cytochrome c5